MACLVMSDMHTVTTLPSGVSDLPDTADRFYHDVFGLERVMDHGWIATYGSPAKMTVQISFASHVGAHAIEGLGKSSGCGATLT